MKTCKTCGEEKSIKDFYSNGCQKNGKRKHKPNCRPCEQEIRIKKHWSKIVSILGHLCCSICGYDNNLSALEFHHRDPRSKEFRISGIKEASMTVLRKELAKCDILCANCHREEHNKHMEKSRILS